MFRDKEPRYVFLVRNRVIKEQPLRYEYTTVAEGCTLAWAKVIAFHVHLEFDLVTEIVQVDTSPRVVDDKFIVFRYSAGRERGLVDNYEGDKE
jgi:hypothetical protein